MLLHSLHPRSVIYSDYWKIFQPKMFTEGWIYESDMRRWPAPQKLIQVEWEDQVKRRQKNAKRKKIHTGSNHHQIAWSRGAAKPATVVVQPSQIPLTSLTLWLVHIVGADHKKSPVIKHRAFMGRRMRIWQYFWLLNWVIWLYYF